MSEAHPDPNASRATFNQVLWTELQALRPAYCKDSTFKPATFDRPEAVGSDSLLQENLSELYRHIGALDAETEPGGETRAPLSALCLSGGGIRSATFNLGVLQALARHKLLGQFDYLSSVSGGGYIASWLQAWVHREQQAGGAVDEVVDDLGQHTTNPLTPEPRAVDHLREFSNYLTPKLGLFSGDTWTAAALALRNLLLNWLVILPLLAALVAIPQGFYVVVQKGAPADWGALLLSIALGAELLAAFSIHYHRRFIREPTRPATRYLWACILPVFAAAALLSCAGLAYAGLPIASSFWSPENWPLIQFCLVWCAIAPAVGWIAAELLYASRSPKGAFRIRTAIIECGAILFSGAAVSLLLAVAIRELLPIFHSMPGLYVVLTLPVLLTLYLLARTLYVAIASLGETMQHCDSDALINDGDREWWARLSGWILAIAIGWIVVTGLCLLAQSLIEWATGAAKPLIAAAGGLSGIAAGLLGSRDKTTSSAQGPSIMQRIALATAAPIFVVCVVLLMSWGMAMLGGWIIGRNGQTAATILANPFERAAGLTVADVLLFWSLPFACLLAALAMGLVVNVNRFSLHGLYRNRLVRAYLGASHLNRSADPFTGFDAKDNLRMYKLRPRPGTPQKLLPLINVTLNLLRNRKLAWQQRKAESFSITPYYCGNFHEGYRWSECYGGLGGISLGTAVTISGAAANPQMGYSSSPSLAFVMSLFNLRLGAWLANTNARGDAVCRLPGPRQALLPMLGELFGFTTPSFKYVNLSDGGHFDNLGLYEVVLRRCRYVFVSDAGCDPDCGFGDLGNAIRKIRIDFGVPIRFEQQIEIYPNSEAKMGLYCAVARIDYQEIDRGAPPGRLFYIKPSMRGRGESPLPYDVYSYGKASSVFPHESTADQWFSESQFESYRMLGKHSLEQIIRNTPPRDLASFFARVAAYMNPERKRRPIRPRPEATASEP